MTEYLSRAKAKEKGIGRKTWKQFHKRPGNMKLKALHTYNTQHKEHK